MKARTRIVIIFLVFFTQLLHSQSSYKIELDLKEEKLPFGLVKKVPKQKPIVSLVLSGGGARALSHVGVLKALDELNIPVDHIIGTSMGSVVGALYSAGYSIDDLDSLVQKINWEELFFISGADRTNLFFDQKVTEDISLFTVRLDGLSPVFPQSINTGRKISNLLTIISLNAPLNRIKLFDNLLYKYRAVSTELITGETVVLDTGSISEAMRASASVSFLLPPIQRDSMMLVDGGLVENLPINTAKIFNPDFIIASDATSPLRKKEDLIYPWEIGDQIFTIPSRKVWEKEKKDVDVLILQELDNRKNNDFSNINKLVEQGYKTAFKELLPIKKKIENIFLNNISKNDTIFYNVCFSDKPNKVEQKLIEKFSNKSRIKKSEILSYMYGLYETGNFKKLEAEISTDSLTRITINYENNPIVKSIKILGLQDSLITNGKIQPVFFNTLINKPYNADKTLESLLNLIRFYREKEFIFATINKVKFNKETGLLEIQVDEGVIENLEIKGNINTLDAVITREFDSVENIKVKKSLFEENLQNLTATDLFDNICVRILETEDNKNNLLLKLDEKLPNVMRFGLRIDNENYTQLSLDIRNENLFGDGSELGFLIAGSPRIMEYILEHKSNRIFNTYLTYKAQAYYKHNFVNVYSDDNRDEERRFSRSKIAEYRQRFYGGLIGVGTYLKKLGVLTTEFKYEINEITGLASFPKSNEYKKNISSIKLRLQIDSQNKYPYPTKGSFINTFYETAQAFLGGDLSFAKFSFDYKGHFPLSSRSVLTPRFIFGFADETLPLSQQFSFGGQSNFFGYRDYEFRGRQILIGSLQYMYKLPFKIYFDTYFKIRYDIGASWINQEQIQFNNLKHALGATISLDTPIGPADFSVGRSLLLEDTTPGRVITRGPFIFYFTIGYYY